MAGGDQRRQRVRRHIYAVGGWGCAQSAGLAAAAGKHGRGKRLAKSAALGRDAGEEACAEPASTATPSCDTWEETCAGQGRASTSTGSHDAEEEARGAIQHLPKPRRWGRSMRGGQGQASSAAPSRGAEESMVRGVHVGCDWQGVHVQQKPEPDGREGMPFVVVVFRRGGPNCKFRGHVTH